MMKLDVEQFINENIVQTNAAHQLLGVSLSVLHGVPSARLPIVWIIGVSLQCVYAGCWCRNVFYQQHRLVLLVPRLFGRSAGASGHCGSLLPALRSAVVGAEW